MGITVRSLLLVLLVCVTAASAAGLNEGLAPPTLADLLPFAEYAAGVPSQVETTGVAPAERPLRPDEVLAYFQALADASPRARLLEYARSHEGRPLVILAVSDEATIAELDAFRDRHVDTLDPRTATAPRAGDKAVAWMAYGIHGDELSSTDAAAVLAHWLVAGEDDRAKNLRDKLLVLIDPCENPDGRARYLAQITSFAHRTANPDQDDLSHRAVWPWGRGNHYLFDLNRDWFSMVQPESRRSAEIAGWLPQLLVDSHEMGANATYLFPPPRHPFNPHLPASARKWERPFSDDQAAALDKRGYAYFTGEWNEEFFPGYGSSWASYHGAVGILYEMSRTTGTHVRKRGGTLRTFGQAVEHQLTSSVANLTSLANHADEVLSDHHAARRAIAKRGAEGKVRAWIFPPHGRQPERTQALANQLVDQGIEVLSLAASTTVKSLTDARTGEKSDLELEAGTLLVRLDQPDGALARVILDPHVPMDDVFFRDERKYLEKGKGSRLYETTAWSVPLARGVPAFWSGRIPGGDWQPWFPHRNIPLELAEDDWNSLVYDGNPDAAPAALVDLLQAGVTVRVAAKPFAVGGRAFDRGAIVLRREGNPEDLQQTVLSVARRHDLAVHHVGTARATSGPDLGGNEFDVLVAPRVAVLTGMPVAPSAYGYVWHLLDQDLDLRFSALDIGRFAGTDLSRYNVLVFPSIWGGAAGYRHLLGPGGVDKLRRWIEAGGTAIGLGGGTAMLADTETALTTTRLRGQAVTDYPTPVWSIPADEAAAAGRPAAVGIRPAPDDEKKKKTPPTDRTSPYDVAPLLGAGARPFADGVAQGTPLGGAPVALAEWVKSVLPPGRREPTPEDLAAADGRLRTFMPRGAMLRVELDPEAWLNYGLGDEATAWFGRREPLVATPPVRVAARFAEVDALHLGGLLWPEGAARIASTGYATREALGRGQVILFADHPAYRRWMADTERMFVNAILLGPGLGTRWSSPW
ncbi:MAG: hypothetical protein GY838_10595 [bacterium]|nr:hypothetical protein [bacterium]